jgi:hydroxymethylglutaryl-CoA synthase
LQQGKRILVFAYGSGVAATLFSLRVDGDLAPLIAPSQLSAQLAERIVISPTDYDAVRPLRCSTSKACGT